MQRADETPDMITIHSMGVSGEGGARGGESQGKMRDGGGRVREQ